MSYTGYYNIIKEGYNILANSVDLSSYKLSYNTAFITSFGCSTSELFYNTLSIHKSSKFFYSPMNAQVIVLKRILKFILK
jgi:hypothetical protein